MRDGQRDEAATGVAAPLLDHPVVVGLHAQVREDLVLGLHEHLAAEAGERREAHLGVGPVGIHVLDAGLGVQAAAAHLLVGDARDLHLVAVEPGGGGEAGLRDALVLVQPPVAQLALVGRLVAEHAADELHLPALLDGAGPDVVVLGREAVEPDPTVLDDVVIDGDDLREVLIHGHQATPVI